MTAMEYSSPPSQGPNSDYAALLTRVSLGLLASFSVLFHFTNASPTQTDPLPGNASDMCWFHITFFLDHLPSRPAGLLSVQSSRPGPPVVPGTPSTFPPREAESPCLRGAHFSLGLSLRLVTFAVPEPPEKGADGALLFHRLRVHASYPYDLVGFHYFSF